MSVRVEDGWVIDENNNHISIERFESLDAAKLALSSCAGCRDCWDCQGCRDCRGCENCENCKGCRGCRYCEGCRSCEDCEGCENCKGCRGCRYCEGCRSCEDCEGCYYGEGCVGKREQHVAPAIERIHQQVYAAASAPGALDMSRWHSPCGTTHCRAGWVVHLAGEAGRKLEAETSTSFAALQIYRASGYRISPVRFYDSLAKSLDDMKRLAEAEETIETKENE